MKKYLVGGFVRDKFLGRPCKDVDFALEVSSFEDMKEWLVREGYEIKIEEPQYFRIKARPPSGNPYSEYVCDFLVARSDGFYTDGRRPDSVSPCGILEDLSRRDATINAIALDADTDEVLDPFRGLQDLQNKIIRSVGVASERIEEDPLRLFRYIRFASQLDFCLHEDIIDLLSDESIVQQVRRVTVERVREELHKAFKLNTYKTMFNLTSICHKSVSEYLFSETGLWLLPTSKK